MKGKGKEVEAKGESVTVGKDIVQEGKESRQRKSGEGKCKGKVT